MSKQESLDHLKGNEKRLQEIIETIPQGIWRTNPDGSADYFSERFYQIVGYTADEFLGWGWSQVIHPDDRDRVLQEWKHCRDNKKPVSVDFRILRKDGSYRWYLSLGNPFFDDHGELIKYFGTWTDIHIEKIATKELQLKGDALENSINGFDIVDAQGRIIYANKAYLRMWGYDSFDEIKGTSPASHCADPSTPEKIIRALKETGECNIEFVARRKDGSTFDVNMMAHLAHDSEGHEIYPSTSIDITEQKQIQKTLLYAKNEAERANELKSAFLANMSHEIRTPLGAMIGFADLLRDPNLTAEERANDIDILVRNGNSLSVIINDILDLSKVESGHLTLETMEVRPSTVVQEVISLMKLKADEKNLRLEFIQDPTVLDVFTTDPVRLRQILLNLVGNAIKFTSQGHVIIRCFGDLSNSKRKVAGFEIRDSGIGIPESQASRVFNMFVQADGSMTRRFGGTGLGLALSRKLARAMGGDVVLKESIVDKGSTFVLTVEDQPKLAPSQNADWIRAAQEKTEISSKVDLQGVRVLIADDAVDNRQLISRYLEKQGAETDFAENGLDAFRKALYGNFDIVLMDLQMPVMDGYSATQKLRDNGYQKPIVALTAHAMSEVRIKCLNVGCTDHLPKPIDFKLLIHVIQKHVTEKINR